ncbi:MAG: proline--tRNA ligase [Candidatus Doudnabacteria bacterium]
MTKSFEKKGLTKKSENISDWYHDVVLRAELAEYSDVKGCMIIRPRGYAIWEKAQAVLDSWFKEGGVQNVYFPIFIPMSLFQKEKEHVEGFSPELAVVTIGGGEKLAEPLAVRPTSETVITQKFAEWIHSHRDLPMKLNQWCNIVRWEKRTYPFLRTSEFLWQEGHTAHADRADAMKMVLTALGWYKKFYEEYYGISLYVGLKSRGETFAGAVETYAIELVMPDGKALQAATSHYLGEKFGKVFNVQYLDEKGEKQFVHQTSWGFSTRAVGGLILTHGDDSGLVLPPKIAPVQVVILPISNKDPKVQEAVVKFAQKVMSMLMTKDIRAELDDNFKSSLGFRINDWELKGVPLRLEIGGKELEAGTVQYVRRDNFEKGQMKAEGIDKSVSDMLDLIQKDLYKKSDDNKKALTFEASEIHEFKRILEEKKAFIRVPWCEQPDCEARVKADTKATPRVLELELINKKEDLKCFACGKNASRRWLFAQSY